jgi:hypothetical protein
MELARQVLLQTEKSVNMGDEIDLNIAGYALEEFYYHVKILADAGFH